MKKTIGIFAHVDAGKTTFSEQILYNARVIKEAGSVDKGTSNFDTNEIERERGITIFSDMAYFTYKEDEYYLIDTPGHTDFSPEAQRVIITLDYAVLIISGTSSVQSGSITMFNLLKGYRVPTFIFINKADIETVDIDRVVEEIQRKITKNSFLLNRCDFECLANYSEEFLEKYLEDNVTSEDFDYYLKKAVKDSLVYPVFYGSALKNMGINEFLEALHRLTYTDYKDNEDFKGIVFKTKIDDKNNKIHYIKALSGSIGVKDDFFEREKINEIRFLTGNRYINKKEARCGDVFAVIGLKSPKTMDIITKTEIIKSEFQYDNFPLMQSGLVAEDKIVQKKVLEFLSNVQETEPTMNVSFKEESNEILINVMGKIQIEVLDKMLAEEGFNLKLKKPEVIYKETIGKEVEGIGHFEPLRHYAEVRFLLKPGERNSGIKFTSVCPVDRLSKNYQNLIRHNVFEKKHKGVLTGSELTDVEIVLLDGLSHIKHTEGGDFRQAVYRGIRQGLEKAQSVLLEPFYTFEIILPQNYVGRLISDIQKLRGNVIRQESLNDNTLVQGKVPVSTFMDYQKEILSYTKGMASIVLFNGGYDLCENDKEVMEKISYDKDKDFENISSSVFCSKGAGFSVPWYDVEKYSHTLKNSLK